MNGFKREAVLVAALLLGAALPAAAQPRQPQFPALRVGASVEGTLAEADPTLSERGRFKVYRFDATGGQRYVATLRSSDFDAYLSVARTVGGITDFLDADDDRGGDTNARLRFKAPATGTYLLIAQALEAEGTGGFTLQLENAPEPRPAVPQPVALGAEVSGTLAEDDPMLEEDETFYDLYTIQGRAGQRLTITLRSEAFDAYLGMGQMEGGVLNATETDDDGAGGTDARLRVTLPADGEYVIRANSLGTGTGAYTLRVEERGEAAAPAAPQPVTAGPEVGGTLDENDAELEDGSFYDYWVYRGRQGEQLTISLSSDDFDTFVAVGRMVGGTFEEVGSADDGGEGTNSLLEVTLPEAGEYLIRANSLMSGQSGAYRLRVQTSANR